MTRKRIPITVGLAALLVVALRPTPTAPSASPVHPQSGRIESLSVVRLPLQSVLLDPGTSNLVHNLSALGLTPASTVTFVSGNGTTGSDGSLGVFWSSAGVSFSSTPNVVCTARFEPGDAAFCRVSGVDTAGVTMHFGRFDGLGMVGRVMFIAMGLAN